MTKVLSLNQITNKLINDLANNKIINAATTQIQIKLLNGFKLCQ